VLRLITAFSHLLVLDGMVPRREERKTPPRPRTKPNHPDDKDQSARFIETAIERGADRVSSPADRLLGKLAKMPPEPRKPADQKK